MAAVGGGIGFGGGGGGGFEDDGGGAGYGGCGGIAFCFSAGGGGLSNVFVIGTASSVASNRTGDGQVTITYDPTTDACPIAAAFTG